MHRLIWIAILSLSGCLGLIYDDRCGEESRSVHTAARILTPQGDTLGYVTLHLSETHAVESREVVWHVIGEGLRGHIEAARVVASEDTSTVFFSLTGGTAEPDIIITGQLLPYTGPLDFNRLFGRAKTGGLTVVLETDFPGRRTIVLPLQLEQFLDWDRAHCS
jgi:hypothetical protein